ncbi:MAG: hypothetical protein O3A55_03275 [Bacteroidetes bacterium]|nr:hypothetical protein [Bacteroidota bacterium]
MKNKILIFIFIIFSILIFDSCYWRSLHPLYSKSTLIMDTTIIGAWQDKDFVWEISKANDTSYSISINSNGKKINFIGHLVNLGNYKFLDIFPKRDDAMDDDYSTYFEPVHSFSRIWIYEDSIQTSEIEYEWLQKNILDKNVNLKYEVLSDDRFLITSSTNELQKFALKYADDKSAFKDKQTSYKKK